MRQSRRRTTCRYKRYFWSVCANHSQIVGCLHFTRVYQRLLGVDDGSFDRRREAERQRREQLGKFVVGIRNWLCLVLKSVPSHLNGRTHREWD